MDEVGIITDFGQQCYQKNQYYLGNSNDPLLATVSASQLLLRV
jgi:hypothetical protein